MTAQAVRMYFLLYKAGAMPFFVVDYSLGWPALNAQVRLNLLIKNKTLAPYKKISTTSLGTLSGHFE